MKYKFTTHELANIYLDSISPVYEESRLMQAIQDALAAYSLRMELTIDEIVDQFFPQTATFTIGLWEESVGIEPDESKPLEERRAAVLSRKVRMESLTPERLSSIIQPLLNEEQGVLVEEGIGKHTFRVSVISKDTGYDQKKVIDKVREVKPSHKSFQIGHAFPLTEISLNTEFIAQKFRPKYAGEIVCGQWPQESTRPIIVESDIELETEFIPAPNRYLFPGERRTNEPNLHGTIQLEENYDMIIDQGSATDMPDTVISGGEVDANAGD